MRGIGAERIGSFAAKYCGVDAAWCGGAGSAWATLFCTAGTIGLGRCVTAAAWRCRGSCRAA